MRQNPWLPVLLSGACLIWGSSRARAANPSDARGQLPIDIQEIYKGLLWTADKEDWETLRAGIDIIEPMILETDKLLGLELNREIHASAASKDAGKVRITLRKIIGSGVKSLLIQSHHEAEIPTVRQRVRQAFTEFLLIKPELKGIDFVTSQKIMGGFRRAYALAAGSHEEYIANCQQISKWLDDLMFRLEGHESRAP